MKFVSTKVFGQVGGVKSVVEIKTGLISFVFDACTRKMVMAVFVFLQRGDKYCLMNIYESLPLFLQF